MSNPTTYADLIKRRTPQKARTVKHPLCLDMALWDAYNAAKAAHAEAAQAERASTTAGQKPTRSGYASRSPLDEAMTALTEATQAMWAMSLWVVFSIPSALEQDKMIRDLEKGEFERGGTEWIIGYLVARFDHATDPAGQRIDDFTAATLRSELEGSPEEGRQGRTMGELLAMQKPIVDAIVTTDFPTPPKR